MTDQYAPVIDLHHRRLLRDLDRLGVNCTSLLERCTVFELNEIKDAAVRDVAGMSGGPSLHATIAAVAGIGPKPRRRTVA